MRTLIVLVVAGSFLCAAPVGAQASKNGVSRKAKIRMARQAFTKGTEAYENGNFPTALDNFRRAYKLTSSPDLLYNIATVNDRMRRDDDALRAYLGYIEARPKSPDREHVQGRINGLRRSIAARKAAKLEAEKRANKRADEAALAAEERVRKERPLTRYVGPGVGPWITIGVSSAALAAGAVVLGLGQRDKNKVEDAPEGTSFSDVESFHNRATRRTKVGIAMMSAGTAGVVGGVIWQLVGGRTETVVPKVSIGPTGVSVRGSF